MAMSPEERRRLKAERERVNRERAFEDYYQLGARRSVDLLFETYKAKVRENGEYKPKSVPTLNKPTLYAWAREDDWRNRALKLDGEQIEEAKQDYKAIQAEVRSQLKSGSKEAVSTLMELLKPGHNDNVRRAAADSILDRAGYPRISKNAVTKEDTTPEVAIPEGMSAEQLITWLMERSTS